jgi:CDGSH-type Zn-finger protein
LVNGIPVEGEHQSIKVIKDGPYLVNRSVPLSIVKIIFDEEGTAREYHVVRRFPLKATYSLCRCGKSGNKPFCDGAHVRTGFKGKETRQGSFDDGAEMIEGPNLILYDNRDLCVAARFCHRAGGVWALTQDSDDPEARKIAKQIVAACPSGRLVICDKRTGKTIEPRFRPSIQLIEDRGVKDSGPIWVRGGIPIISSKGKEYEVRNRVTLCRCGRSGNMPFCDGNHLRE